MRGILLFIVGMGIIGVNMSIFIPQIVRSNIKYEKNMRKVKDIEVQIAVMEEQIADYGNKTKALEDPFYIEKIGREKLKMVKDGEKIYKLVD